MKKSRISAAQIAALPADPDPRRRAAATVLIESKMIEDTRVAKHICTIHGPALFDFEAMLQEGWSSTEALVLKAAWAMYNNGADVDLGRLVDYLNERQFNAVMRGMLCMRRLSSVSLHDPVADCS